MRGRNRTVTANREMPLAVAAPSLAWAATPPMAAHIHPAPAKESPSAREPTVGSPKVSRATVTAAAKTRLAPNTATKAAVSGAMPYGGGAEQFASARLLLGAGMADHQEQARDPGQEHAHDTDPPRDQTSQARSEDGAEHAQGRRVAVALLGEGLACLGGGVELLEGGRLAGGDEHGQGDEEREQDPIPSEDQPDQRPGTGEGGHQAIPSCRAVPPLGVFPVR